MKFIRKDNRSISECVFSLGLGTFSVTANAILDCGSQIITIPFDCYKGSTLPDYLVEGIRQKAIKKYRDKIIYTKIADGSSKRSILVVAPFIKLACPVANNESDMIILENYYVNVLLDSNYRNVLLGWDYVMSHRKITNDEQYSSLLEFDNNLYLDSVKNYNPVYNFDLRCLLSECMSDI